MPINRLINNADIEKVSEGLLSVKNNCFINKMLLSVSFQNWRID